jgi:hypothetical protein
LGFIPFRELQQLGDVEAFIRDRVAVVMAAHLPHA